MSSMISVCYHGILVWLGICIYTDLGVRARCSQDNCLHRNQRVLFLVKKIVHNGNAQLQWQGYWYAASRSQVWPLHSHFSEETVQKYRARLLWMPPVQLSQWESKLARASRFWRTASITWARRFVLGASWAKSFSESSLSSLMMMMNWWSCEPAVSESLIVQKSKKINWQSLIASTLAASTIPWIRGYRES